MSTQANAQKPNARPRLIVTAALPYANGSLHLGHLVEYCQADMYVRAHKRLGSGAIYLCANDAHGTPIEVNAGRLGITPEALVAGVHAEHKADFAKYDVAFDHFTVTHSDTNRAVVLEIYQKLRARGLLEERDTTGSYCTHDQRFLPDRFVKGTCPYCGAVDQYGDVCESCQRTYAPADLKEPKCVLCGHPPVERSSRHVFFKLSDKSQVDFLRQWIDSGTLQPDQANYVRTWIDKGLRDWCITRDGPYFGFDVPDMPGKYFYVWLDAPIGYIAAAVEWGERFGFNIKDLWQSPDVRIEHLIGKDIVYFHSLFWPAVLAATGFTTPAKIHVHGMLTIDGQKMSKSRGTFIKAAVFASHVDPQALRYYYACKYGAGTEDLDLAFDDLVARVNAELVNKHANLFSRAAQFVHAKLGGTLGDLPFSASEAQTAPGEGTALVEQARRVVALCQRVEQHYKAREFGHAVRDLCAIADIGNEYMQAQAPWEQLKNGDEQGARATCTFALNVCHALAMYLWPIVPRFCETGARMLGVDIDRMDTRQLFTLRNKAIGPFERLFDRIERAQIDRIIEASKETTMTSDASKTETTTPPPAAPAPAVAAAAPTASDTIDYETFKKVELKVGVVRVAEPVKKSKKLLRLEIDLGEPTLRQIVAGIAEVYPPEKLIGRQVVVVANLAPAKLMGVESRGMVLAADTATGPAVLLPEREVLPGAGVR